MASGGYDGSIRIKVDTDTNRAVTKIQNLEAKLRRQTEAMERQANRVSDLKAKYDKLASGDVAPKSLGVMERKLQDAQREAAALEAKMQELGTKQELAIGVGDTRQAQALELEIERLGQKLIAAETTYDAKMTRVESDVLSRAREVREMIAGARGSLTNQEKLLSTAITARQMYIKQK